MTDEKLPTSEAKLPNREPSPFAQEAEPTGCIAIITDADFGLDPKPLENPTVRHGARGVILNDQGQVAVLHMANIDIYKLIGGGVEESEDPETAFRREALEEAGCEIAIDQLLGTIREEKSRVNFVQDSSVFLAHLVSDTGETHYTEKEISRGAEPVWLDLETALEKIHDSETRFKNPTSESNAETINPDDVYQLRFILRRDYKILRNLAQIPKP